MNIKHMKRTSTNPLISDTEPIIGKATAIITIAVKMPIMVKNPAVTATFAVLSLKKIATKRYIIEIAA